MKHGILTTALLLLLAASAGAQEIGCKLFQSHDMGIAFPNRTELSSAIPQSAFQPFRTNIGCLSFLERITSCEYDLVASNCVLQVGLDTARCGVTTRLKLFNREIYLTFSYID